MENLNENNEDVEHGQVFELETTQSDLDQQEGPPYLSSYLSGYQTRAAIRSFLSLTGGSILYCLSAASIVYGIGQIIGPALAKSILLSQTLPCLLAINLYELALLAVLVIIVRFRNVTDDAVSLLILIALFLITSGLTLGTLTPGNPQACFYIGLACIGLALGKLYTLRRLINFPIGTISLAGFGLIFSWNFLAAPLMGKPLVTGDWPEEMRRGQWLLWWLVLLLGAGMIWADALISSKPQGSNKAASFIRTPSMVWIFALILLGAAAIYQRATTYMYVIDCAWGDYLPLLVVFSLLLIELFRSLGKQYKYYQLGVSVLPLIATVYAIIERQVMAWPSMGVELLWYPPVILGLTGLAMLGLALYHRWTGFYYVAILYALGVILTFGYTPGKPFDLNWELFAAGVVTVLFVIGLIKQNFLLCFGAVILLSGGLGVTDSLARFARVHNMTNPGMVFGIAGIGTLAVCSIFGPKVHKGFIVFGAVCLMFCLFDYLPKTLAWKDLVILVGILLVSIVLWFRTRFLFVLPILSIPLLPKFYLFARSMSSWGFIVLSFVLLFLGGVVSFFFKDNKSLQMEVDQPTVTME
ncbi:MAG: hypothetical protein ABFR90_11800 [Planctomycetota bacterium]